MMIVMAWLIYCVLIAAVLTAGAFAWEAGARWSGGSARWGWLAALAGTVTLPWLLRLMPAAAVESIPVSMPLVVLDPVMIQAGAESGLGAGEIALALWLGASLLVLLYVGAALVKLARVRSRWRTAELEGGPVLLSNGVGPAAVGVRSAMVVLPAWVLELDAEMRSLLLRHEREHVRAGDPRLLFAGLMLLSAMPWNPLVWLQVLRLRNAIELDCDARVLRAGADPRRYGSLLLEVGRRRSAHALVMATFAEPRVFLEERIRRIARWPLDRRPLRAVAFTIVGLLLFATALSARDPLRVPALPVPFADAPVADAPVAAPAELIMPSDTPPMPTFTPMTQRPELTNRDEVTAALAANYPPLLRDAGIGGSAMVFFYINERGVVEHVRMSKPSGYPALDEAALVVARMMRFTPARNRDRIVPVWVEIPVVFGTIRSPVGEPVRIDGFRNPRVPPRVQVEIPDPPPTSIDTAVTRMPVTPIPEPRVVAGVSTAPVFTPMTVRPEMRNRDEVSRALVRAYPPLLRDAGIGGSPVLWFYIDENGDVLRTQLSKTSGHPALDEAAISVAAVMKWTPARNRDRIVPVWIEVPVVFSAR